MGDPILRRPHGQARRCPWRAQPAPGKSVQLSLRLKTAPQLSACLGKRERPRRAPAPAAHVQAMGASKCPRHGPLNHCSRHRRHTSRQCRSMQRVAPQWQAAPHDPIYLRLQVSHGEVLISGREFAAMQHLPAPPRLEGVAHHGLNRARRLSGGCPWRPGTSNMRGRQWGQVSAGVSSH
eukprot:6646420-Pyramimonas_sp.AAC.1